VVPTSAGEALAQEFGIPFMETSAVSSINVDEAFDKLIHAVYDVLESQGMLPPKLSTSNSVSPISPATGKPAGNNSRATDQKATGGLKVNGAEPPKNASCC
jgi:hypothetical protein